MLNKYNNLKQEIALNSSTVKKLKTQISEHTTVETNLQRCIMEDERNRNYQIDKQVDKMLNEKIDSLTSKYNIYYTDLNNYKMKVHSAFNDYRVQINSNTILDTVDYDIKYSKLIETYNRVYDTFSKYISEDIIELYGELDYGVDLVNGELERLESWLDYFKGYDDYDKIIGRVKVLEERFAKIEDKTFFFITLLAALGFLLTFKYYIVIPYILFIIASLVIRCREYYILLKLLGSYNILKTYKDSSDAKYQAKVEMFIKEQDESVSVHLLKYTQIFQEIKEAIESQKVLDEKQIRTSFNRDEARKDAEKSVEDTKDNLEKRLEEEHNIIEGLEKELTIKTDELQQKISALQDLKVEIKSTFENLEPSFESYDLLDTFFLGFDKDDEPVTFKYGGDPTLIFYDSAEPNQLQAVMSTLSMMCGQIICAMNPMAYKITVVDNFTGGASLSAFQVTDDVEDGAESELFKVVTTSQESNKLVKTLYEVYNTRRVKILGNYDDVESFNREKLKYGARTQPFVINFFYEYDYKLLESDEMLRQLCRVCKSVGIALIFTMDLDKIGAKKNYAEDTHTSNKNEKIYPYTIELLTKVLDLFTEDNIFGFNITDSVEIVSLTKEVVKKAVENNI